MKNNKEGGTMNRKCFNENTSNSENETVVHCDNQSCHPLYGSGTVSDCCKTAAENKQSTPPVASWIGLFMILIAPLMNDTI